jgi:hypothetical protein
MRSTHREAGEIVLGWLTKVIVGLAIAFVLIFDAGSIGIAHFNTSDDANSAATAAADQWATGGHNVQAAYQAAVASITHSGESIVPGSFGITPDGIVHLKVQKVVKTLVLRFLGPLKKLTVVVGSGSAQWTNS